MTEQQELTKFERGLIIGAWLFDHTEREIEEQTGIPKSTIHDKIATYYKTIQRLRPAHWKATKTDRQR